MCSLHLTHPSVHTWSSGQPTVQRPGSSRGLLVGAGIRTHNLGLPWVSSATLYPLGHLSRCDGGAFVVVSETRRFTGNALEDVVDERVHDPHRLRRDPGVWMDLLHHFVDVNSVALLPGLSTLLSYFNSGLSVSLLGALLRSGLCWFRHDDNAAVYSIIKLSRTQLFIDSTMLIFTEI